MVIGNNSIIVIPLNTKQDLDLGSLVSCMEWLWDIQQDLELEDQLKNEARKALYKGYHAMRRMAVYLEMPLRLFGKSHWPVSVFIKII